MKKPIALLFLMCCLASTQLSAITPKQLSNIDLDKDYNSKNVSELRLIKSMVSAKHGYLFMRSELRDYFITNFKWYDSTVYKRQELIDEKKPVPPIIYSAKENAFIAKIDALIKEKEKQNILETSAGKVPNLHNLGNCFDEQGLPSNMKQMLGKYGFAIAKDTLEQLFHLYDQNQYTNTPSFITTDLYLQLLHIYFSYTLKVLEKEKLGAIVTSLSKQMNRESLKYLSPNYSDKVKEMAKFNSTYFAIAYTLLTGENVSVAPGMLTLYHQEIAKVNDAIDDNSPLFGGFMPYSLFIPRGYYTRTEVQKRYFKAMMWLQVAPFCLSNEKLLQNACFNAFVLNSGKDAANRPLKELYKAVYDPIAFMIGEGDNLSVMDICHILTKANITNIDLLTNPKTVEMIATQLREKVKTQDKIQPKMKLACYPKINFMPQRYLVDNDILQQFIDTTRNAAKAFPKGLEFFSVMGNSTAKDLLYNHYKENEKWAPYDTLMKAQTAKFAGFSDWNNTLYNKWLDCLMKLNRENKQYPYFMQNRGWKLKNLNTALASWAELKHDAILYGEEPTAAEMGDGEELPPPITVGYVEPNIEFWNAAKEMLLKNEQFLVKYNLMTDTLANNTKSVKELVNFLTAITQKELAHQPLTNKEYNEIEFISGKFDYLSLSMLTPYINYGAWYNVIGADKTIALVADVYTRNVPYCSKNGILHEATGLGNRIYVVVEIEGHLYLTRGATFSYYEFPYEERLTDERWLNMMQNNEIAPVDWIHEISIEYNDNDNEQQ